MSFLKLTKDLGDFSKLGGPEYDYGQGLTNEGLGGLRTLGGQYQYLIDQGGLPQDIRNQFNIARGGLRDNATRAQRDFAARLAQKYATSGGMLSPSASLEYGLENQKNTNESLFNATNNLNMGESQMALENTNNLFSHLEGISKSIAGIGQSEEDRARAAQTEAIKAKLQNKQTTYSLLKFW